jgi:hypothetical protein
VVLLNLSPCVASAVFTFDTASAGGRRRRIAASASLAPLSITLVETPSSTRAEAHTDGSRTSGPLVAVSFAAGLGDPATVAAIDAHLAERRRTAGARGRAVPLARRVAALNVARSIQPVDLLVAGQAYAEDMVVLNRTGQPVDVVVVLPGADRVPRRRVAPDDALHVVGVPFNGPVVFTAVANGVSVDTVTTAMLRCAPRAFPSRTAATTVPLWVVEA